MRNTSIAVDSFINCKKNYKMIQRCIIIGVYYFTSIKYLPYISLNALPLLLPIKKTPRMAPPTLTGGTFA